MEPTNPAAWLKEKIYGYWLSQALYCAASLNLADIIHQDGPQNFPDLAKKSNSHPRSLYRLLRLLASENVFKENSSGAFELTPLASLLRSDVPGSQYAMAIMSGSEHYLASSRMIDNVRTGKCAFELQHGKPIFEFLKDHPASARVFDNAMESIHGSETSQILQSYDFSQFNSLADIGGGNGSMLLSVLEKIPQLKAILFDLEHVIKATELVVNKQGVSNRCNLVAGDFFEAINVVAGAYILRHIIHDWDDEKSILILNNIRKVIPKGGRVLVVEAVLPEGNTPHPGKMFDWIMMAIPGGLERTFAEYQELFLKSGFQIQRVIATAGLNSILEAVPI